MVLSSSAKSASSAYTKRGTTQQRKSSMRLAVMPPALM